MLVPLVNSGGKMWHERAKEEDEYILVFIMSLNLDYL